MKFNLFDTGYFFDELFESGGRVRPEAETERRTQQKASL